jgi:hypothetical protein
MVSKLRPLLLVFLLLAFLLLEWGCSNDTDPAQGPSDRAGADASTSDTGDLDARTTRDAPSDSNEAPDATDVAADTTDASDTADVYNPDEPLDILFVGNSFTLGGPVPVIVEELVIDAGWPTPRVDWSAFGGETLEGHRARQETVDKIDQGGWEVVVLQEYSTRPTDNIGDPAQFKADAAWFYDRIQQSSPGARVVLYETWARHPDHQIYPGSFEDPPQMQAQLRSHYNDCAHTYIPANATGNLDPLPEVAPVGDAWEHHLSQADALRLHGGDDYHAGRTGQYLNGLVIYATIYRRTTQGRASWQLTSSEAARLQSAADAITGQTQLGGPLGQSIGLQPGQEVRVDLGSQITTEVGWNNMSEPVGGSLYNAVDADGESTSVDVVVTDGFVGANDQGLGANDLGWPADASGDTFWTGSFDGHSAALDQPGQLTIRGLDPQQTYTVGLFASRSGDDTGRGRLTRYTIDGRTQDLEVSDNTSTTVEFASVTPTAQGEVVIEVLASPAGAARFGYVGVLDITGE